MLIYSTLAQIVPILERWLASGAPVGQLSSLVYAMKLTSMPVTVISTSSVIVSFVGMSQDNARHNLIALRETLVRGARLTTYLLLMATIGLVFLGGPLVDMTLRRGEFTRSDANLTAGLLAVYALGIVPGGLAVILTRSYQARGELWIPLRTGVANTILYFGFSVLLFRYWGVFGLAAAFSISQLANALLLEFHQPSELRVLDRTSLRFAGVLLLMSGLTSGLIIGISQLLAFSGTTGRTKDVALLVLGGIAILGASTWVGRQLRVKEGILIGNWLKRLVPLRRV
jgi:putative peptidoglycan lipid II flippase